ncbi:MAG: hypothetical protein J2P16_07505 [Mycobacterium sp.]|nr:hypothetical protein [Mycobacterium sp.]
MNHVFMYAAVFLADDAPRHSGPDFGKASPFGLLVIVLLLIGTFLLVRSMNRHLAKLPESFDPDNPRPDQAADEGTVGVDPPADRDGSAHEPDG